MKIWHLTKIWFLCLHTLMFFKKVNLSGFRHFLWSIKSLPSFFFTFDLFDRCIRCLTITNKSMLPIFRSPPYLTSVYFVSDYYTHFLLRAVFSIVGLSSVLSSIRYLSHFCIHNYPNCLYMIILYFWRIWLTWHNTASTFP